jgi:FdhE protein
VERFRPSFRRLAEEDPIVRPLALLYLALLHATVDPVWDSAAVALKRGQVESGVPLLHGLHLQVDPAAAMGVLVQLLEAAGEAEVPGLEPVQAALVVPGSRGPAVDPLSLLRAAITWDLAELESLAHEVECDPAVLATLGHLASQPLLLACGRRAEALAPAVSWAQGYCPVCAAWPTLAETRGAEQQRWLRCGRCGAGWQFPHHRCPFCSNADHRTLGYMAAEADRESRKAGTCDACRSYLKSISTLGPLSLPEIVLADLETLELDAAALEQEYGRPDRPGFPLQLQLSPLL